VAQYRTERLSREPQDDTDEVMKNDPGYSNRSTDPRGGAQTLRDLERDGLITRHVFPTKPPTVEYRLAPLGQSLLDPMAGLIDWADRRHTDIHGMKPGKKGW
jgi:hypothetical protein